MAPGRHPSGPPCGHSPGSRRGYPQLTFPTRFHSGVPWPTLALVTLPTADRDRIVALRLDGRSVRDTATETGHAPGTVAKYWNAYLAETAQARRVDLGLLREEVAQRVERSAADARSVATRLLDAGDDRGALRALSEERAALRQLADLYGLANPAKPPTLAPPVSTDDPAPYRYGLDAYAHLVAGVVYRSLEDARWGSVMSDPLADLLPPGVPREEVEAQVVAALDSGD